MRMRRTAALALCGLLFSGALASCGGDDDDSGDVGLEEVTDDAGGEQATDDTADEADQDDGDEPTTIDDIPGLSEECQVFVDAANAFASAFGGGSDSQNFDDLAEALDRFADSAPEAIADDVRVLADGYEQFAEEFGDLDLSDPATFSDPEVAQRLAEAGQIFEDPQFTEASDNIEAFVDANCANG